jgi:hypothetical protein
MGIEQKVAAAPLSIPNGSAPLRRKTPAAHFDQNCSTVLCRNVPPRFEEKRRFQLFFNAPSPTHFKYGEFTLRPTENAGKCGIRKRAPKGVAPQTNFGAHHVLLHFRQPLYI